MLTLVVGTGLWFASVGSVDVRQMNDLGLISQVPPTMLIGTALIGLGLVLTMRLDPVPVPLALVGAVLVILTIHGLPTYVEDAPRFSVAYLHAGFTDVIARDGILLPGVDARFSWPLFFAWGALVTQVAGIPNAIALQPWAPIVSNLLYLVPLVVMFRALTEDRRLVWTAAFVFLATNWVGQDYYAPQAFNYLIYLTVLAIVLRWFGTRATPHWIDRFVRWLDARWPGLRAPMRAWGGPAAKPPIPSLGRTQRTALVGFLALLMAASAASHQLTPFAILASLVALTLVGRNQLRGLPILVGVMTATWISYMTVVFLAGNLPGLLGDVFAAAQTADANVGQRLAGSQGHLLVVQTRVVFTLLLWMLAALGAIRRYRWGNLDLEAVALAAVPFGLMLFQAYGGEMLLRVYLFSLPFVAYLAAGLILPRAGRSLSPSATRALSVLLAILLIGLIVTKHGNERADYISADELAAVDRLYSLAPAGSVLAAVNFYGPVRYRQFEAYSYRLVPDEFLFGTADDVRASMETPGACSYFFVSRSQEATARLFYGVSNTWWQRSLAGITDSGDFQQIFGNEDVRIYLALPAPATCRGA